MPILLLDLSRVLSILDTVIVLVILYLIVLLGLLSSSDFNSDMRFPSQDWS